MERQNAECSGTHPRHSVQRTPACRVGAATRRSRERTGCCSHVRTSTVSSTCPARICTCIPCLHTLPRCSNTESLLQTEKNAQRINREWLMRILFPLSGFKKEKNRVATICVKLSRGTENAVRGRCQAHFWSDLCKIAKMSQMTALVTECLSPLSVVKGKKLFFGFNARRSDAEETPQRYQ